MSGPRVAFGGFLHETNTFAPSPATYADFVSGSGHVPLCEGAEIAERTAGANLAITGALAYGAEQGWTAIPTLWATTSPSAHVAEEAFERIAARLIERLRAALPLDGVFLDLHGAMVCAHLDDGEGALLTRVRAAIGPRTPLVASLDLHANVTAQMVAAADLLEAYRTYPHVDMAATGTRAAAALGAMIAAERRPTKALRRVAFLMPIAWQCTDMAPARGLFARLERLTEGGARTMSLNMGFPAADFPECGPTILAYGEGAEAAADTLYADVLAAEAGFAGEVFTPENAVAEALRRARGASRPVVLADTQDNPGAGGNSDTMGLARALVSGGAEGAALGNIFDPEAARACHAAGLGATLRLSLGGRSRIPGDAPLEAEFTVTALSNGRFRATGPYYGGAEMNLGPSACLRLNGVDIVVTSAKAQMADRQMFRHLRIEPEARPILGLKSSVHFRADFAPVAAAILVVAAPGPMAVDPATLPWTRLAPGLRLRPLGPTFERTPRCPHSTASPTTPTT